MDVNPEFVSFCFLVITMAKANLKCLCHFCYALFRYQKLQKGKLEEGETAGLSATNPAAKYVILEEMEDQDDVP